MTADALVPGAVVWVDLDPVAGREQGGRRPAVVVAGREYLDIVDTLAVLVPVTTVDRGWSNHIRLEGADLPRDSWAMTEQVRTVSRDRIVGRAGTVDEPRLREIRLWLRDFLELG
ncbi:MAG: type II toxin-antitoxin system PemK/MazF family toxin [Gordonia sp. (in: high G+C Gram-positive bacteria)]|uniref:type II toxin-antitoxin system PemK/MazF family toxin n=1 Tax=Gordonia sp. (in: high G+C Gram-positive bacteria) TaxID=84139 RepID=UPI0039E63671